MNAEEIKMDRPKQILSMHPQKFALWLFIVSVMMMFAALTSAYIVKQADNNWLLFDMPDAFVYTSIVIVLSSVTMHWAYLSAKKDNIPQAKAAVLSTFVLGIIFLIGQYQSWSELVEMDVYFVGNPAGSFIYVLTGLHGLHLISALIFLFIVFIAVFRYKVHSKRLNRIEMCTTYWHFLGGLWLYLYFFLLLNS
ncbi:MAG TPA: cytochrome oxidase subunit III [Cytophagales bacterium]|jgi:cytochrome c oxidase subunit 3|nr:cytochrome oxidase subunit III [Cytophagales bacterium]